MSFFLFFITSPLLHLFIYLFDIDYFSLEKASRKTNNDRLF